MPSGLKRRIPYCWIGPSWESPAFAFAAYSSLRRGDTALARLAEPQLRAANATRMPVPKCLTDSAGWRTLNDSTLLSFFAADGKRWQGFRERFPQTPKFALLSQAIVSGDSATIYVAIASDNLAGRGVILLLGRDSEGVWVKRSELQIWIS
jgi:hypothetical protein